MEEVLRRENMMAAHARVVRNGGAPGVDGMTVDDLMPYCREHWARIREELLGGTYHPQPVRRVEIPKPDGQGHADAGHPDGARPDDSAGPAPSPLAHLRPDVLGRELRLSSGTEHAPSSRARPRAHRGGTSVGGGPGPREILRPGEPRRADGARGAAGEGQTSAAPDPPLSCRRG